MDTNVNTNSNITNVAATFDTTANITNIKNDTNNNSDKV